MIIIGCSRSRGLARKISKRIDTEYSDLEVNKFPDGELYVKFNTEIKNKEVVLVQSLNNPNEAILEVIFAAHTAKDLGAKKIILVVPYLAYMRQDKRFNSGEAITSKIIGKLFNVFDKIITIDPHLHRYKNLNEVFSIKTEKLSTIDLIGEYIKNNIKNAFIIGPDMESYQWAETIAKSINCPFTILKKERINSKKVNITINSKLNIKNKNIVMIDDIISTGQTILKTIDMIKKQNPKSINIVCVHGIFSDQETYKKLSEYKIITTNTIETKHSKIDVSELIANSLKSPK